MPDNSKPGLNVNQYEIIDGKKETLLDFVHKVTTFRVNDPTRMNQSQEDLRKLSRELIDNCGAKKGSEL